MSESLLKNAVFAELKGRDSIELKLNSEGQRELHFVGCEEFSQLILQLKVKYGPDPVKWVPPAGAGHASLLIREFIAKACGLWNVVYDHDELCHCRLVRTEVVEQAILAGAHTSEKVSLWTSASTACGTCRMDVEAILAERLKFIR